MYRRLLDSYYAQEQPLTTDKQRLYRIVRAYSTKHKRAVDFIIDSFFVLTDDGYCNSKADKQIEQYRETIVKRRNAGLASAHKRKQKLDKSTIVATNVPTLVPTNVATHIPTQNQQPKTKKINTNKNTNIKPKQTLTSAKDILKKNPKLREGKGGREVKHRILAVNGHPPPSPERSEDSTSAMHKEVATLCANVDETPSLTLISEQGGKEDNLCW